MLYSIFFSLVGFIVFQYIFWKKLRDDYSSEIIFTLSFLGSGIWLLTKTLSFRFLNPYWFWISFIVSLLAFFLLSHRFKVRYFEMYESLIFAFLAYWGINLLSDAVVSESLYSFAHCLFVFGVMFLFVFFDSRYKNFSWYRSGRIGFSGLLSMGVYFSLRAVLASLFPFMLSFTVFEVYLSGTFAFLNFLVLYNLARQV